MSQAKWQNDENKLLNYLSNDSTAVSYGDLGELVFNKENKRSKN